jgi:DNA-binding winged helix-turn-helix (wHTH) protein
MVSEEISFGPFWLDLGLRELRRDGQPVRIHRRALGILCALAEAKGEIVGKDELMARLWPGRIVEEETSTSTFRLCESLWANTKRVTALSSLSQVAVIVWQI